MAFRVSYRLVLITQHSEIVNTAQLDGSFPRPIRSLLATDYLPITRLSLVMVNCTVGGASMATENSLLTYRFGTEKLIN